MFQIILGYSSTSDLIFFNSGALPNILHYITLHSVSRRPNVTYAEQMPTNTVKVLKEYVVHVLLMRKGHRQ